MTDRNSQVEFGEKTGSVALTRAYTAVPSVDKDVVTSSNACVESIPIDTEERRTKHWKIFKTFILVGVWMCMV